MADKVLLDNLTVRRVGQGFVVHALFGRGSEAVEEEKVVGSLPKLKKVVKFYFDELKEDLNKNATV